MGGSGLVAIGPPPMRPWLVYMRYAILALSLVCLALAAWGLSLWSNTFIYGNPGGLVVFVCVWSFIVYGGAIAVELFAPHLFYRVAFLIGYIFSVIFWLSGWSWSASVASAFLGVYTFSTSSSYYDPWRQFGSAMAGCAGIGALVWVMTIVNLVFFIMACVSDPGSNAGQAELGNMKHQAPAASYPATAAGYPAPQQAYPQQGYPQQAAQPQQQPYGQQQPYATQ